MVRPATNNMTVWDRMRAKTVTIVAEEDRKQVAIRHQVEKAESDMAEYRIAQQTRIVEATTKHQLYMLEVAGKIREAQHRAEMAQLKLNAERATHGLSPL